MPLGATLSTFDSHMSIRTSAAAPVRWLRRLTVLVALVVAAPAFAQGAVLGASLQDALSSVTSPLSTLEVVVTYDQEGPLSLVQRTALSALGGGGVFFESLPIAGIVATPAQIGQIASLPGVTSVWLNEELQYSNEDARQLTGVDRLRTDQSLRTSQGLPFSGQGVAVVVNDSGIDATHADLPMGTKVLENVQALTNLNALSTLLPISYIEGTPNTDTNSGHGTHCAGTVAGLGVRSGGLYEGVAPGASLVGYGSGGVILILDGLGGFDYAITHQFSFDDPIRVITNSWGSDGEFQPESPIVQASYRAYQRGINVLFAASNSGPGEDTHNIYAQAPWVISVGAGTKTGALADFSSRGQKGESYDFQTYDGETWTYTNDVSITAPGVDIISTRALTNGGANGGEGDVDAIPPAFLPFYTMISGTSMATPHVAGIVALLLEADPTLDPLEVKAVLQRTATNMPGREPWEAGSGYVNAHAAVASVLGQPVGSQRMVNQFAPFRSEALLVDAGSFPVSAFFNPVGEPETVPFEVPEGVTLVKARATVPANTVAIVLTDPAGNRYGSGITLPVLGEVAAVAAPGMAGTWTYSVSGIGSVSGVGLDPLGVTNGTALPGQIDAVVSLVATDGFTGLDDTEGHPARGFIETAVVERLADGVNNRWFQPDVRLRRNDMARFLVMGTGVRQAVPEDVPDFPFVSGGLQPYFEAVLADGGALKDRDGFDGPVLQLVEGEAAPDRGVTRPELAYSLVSALGLQGVADGYTGDVFATFQGERIRLADSNQIPAEYRGYVQLALDAGLLNATFSIVNTIPGPVVMARFGPNTWVTRADYTVAAVRLHDIYDSVDPDAVAAGGAAFASAPSARSSAVVSEVSLEANAPNPFGAETQIAFTLAEAGPARLAVYDVLGREVAILADGPMAEGRHEVRVDAAGLSTGTYVYRLFAGGQSLVRQMTVVR